MLIKVRFTTTIIIIINIIIINIIKAEMLKHYKIPKKLLNRFYHYQNIKMQPRDLARKEWDQFFKALM